MLKNVNKKISRKVNYSWNISVNFPQEEGREEREKTVLRINNVFLENILIIIFAEYSEWCWIQQFNQKQILFSDYSQLVSLD